MFINHLVDKIFMVVLRANLLYLVVKNHVLIDRNKIIVAILFIYFLKFYGIKISWADSLLKLSVLYYII